MSNTTKIFLAVFTGLLAVAGIASQFIEVRERTFQLTEHTTNSGELTRDVLVGQTIISDQDNLSAIGVMFATYSGRENTEPVEFHLRDSISGTFDIRSQVVDPRKLGDNQLYRFEFEPIAESKGREFFFFITSPQSTAGNAVTVDLDTRDPYHLGSAYIVRGQGSGVTNPEVLARSGKQTSDVVFEMYHTVPIRVAVLNAVTDFGQRFVGTWDEKKSNYAIWGKVTLPAVLFLLVLWLMQPTPYSFVTNTFGKSGFTVGLLFVLLALGIGFRVMYAVELPITNDEGNYLYDARTLREGNLAGGDGYVKAPLVILWVAFWQMLLGDTVLAGRMSSVVIGALTLYPIYFLAKDLWSSRAVTKPWLPDFGPQSEAAKAHIKGWGRRVGLVAAAMWAFFGVAIVSNIYVHTQAVAVFFGVSAVAVLLAALRGTTPRLTFLKTRGFPSAAGWFLFAGILFGLGVASRKSILALGLLPLLFIAFEGRGLKKRTNHLIMVGIGFLIIIACFLGWAAFAYGTEGIYEALGINSAEDGFSAVDPAEVAQVRAYSLRGITPFFRESLPLILLAVLGLGMIWEQMISSFLDTFARSMKGAQSAAMRVVMEYIIPKLGWIPAWIVFAWAWSFFFEYEGSAFMQYGIRTLWWLFGLILAIFTFLPTRRTKKGGAQKDETVVAQSMQPGLRSQSVQTEEIREREEAKLSPSRHIVAAFLPILWVGGLVIFYISWIKFHANYIVEFIPPLVVVGAFGAIILFWQIRAASFFADDHPILEILRKCGGLLLAGILLWSIIVSNYITFLFEHTGTFDQRAAQEAAAWAEANIPKSEEIFTGAAVVPYLSGHHTALDIAHPRWYAYEFTRKDTERLSTFLPSREEMLSAYRAADWFLLEKQTGFSFLMEYTEIEAGLERDWVQVKGISNGSNTLTFYQRVR